MHDHGRRNIGIRVGVNRLGIKIPYVGDNPPPAQPALMSVTQPPAAAPQLKIIPVKMPDFTMPDTSAIFCIVRFTLISPGRYRHAEHSNQRHDSTFSTVHAPSGKANGKRRAEILCAIFTISPVIKMARACRITAQVVKRIVIMRKR